MVTRLVAAAIVVGVTGYCLARIGRAIRAQWFIVRAWYFLSGVTWDGKELTDAGWFRKGHKALTRSGYAPPWWHRPRYQRACHRTAAVLVLFALFTGLFINPVVTVAVTGAALLEETARWGWRMWRRHVERRDRRTWLYPVHKALYGLAGHSYAVRPADWISIKTDAAGAVRWAQLELPEGWNGDEREEKRLALVAANRLGIESAESSWRRAGPVPLLTLAHSPPPPGHVKLADVLDEMAKCGPDEVLIGIGKNDEVIRASLASDSPHLAISMGTGAGKSNLAGFIMLQRLIHGDIGLVLDAKRRLSYPWLLKDMDRKLAQLPNIGYAWTTAQLHAAMCWLDTELDRRGDVAFSGMDTRGKVHAKVGARLFVTAEELNLAVPRLRAHWAENREPGEPAKSPAFTGLGATAFAGRQVRMHLVLIGQMLTAEATGSRDSSVKANCGIMLLARYGPKSWRIMAEDVPMPPAPSVTGRVQVVTAGRAREAQVPEMDELLARQMVLDGIISALPYDMPCQPPRPVTVTDAPRLESGPSPAVVTVTSPVPVTGESPALVSLTGAVQAGILHPSVTIGALRMARHRHRNNGFPAVVKQGGRKGREDLFAADELVAWDAGRR
jgi:hypothetical protein